MPVNGSVDHLMVSYRSPGLQAVEQRFAIQTGLPFLKNENGPSQRKH